MRALAERLKDQNTQGTLWLDCELRGMRHQLGNPQPVRSLYNGPQYEPVSTVRRCRRCPVDILTVR